jgi:molybdopterin/thiamine biosynthesis adenylyltransferase
MNLDKDEFLTSTFQSDTNQSSDTDQPSNTDEPSGIDQLSMTSRYAKQIRFAPIGESGQQRLHHARVVIIGLGALGCVTANHLARAGVGYLRLIDRDYIEFSNLQRQMLYDEQDVVDQLPKAIAAANRLRRINADITIEPHVTDLNASNAEQLLHDVDVILDGTDNFSVRYLINDFAIKANIPWIYGGAVASRGVSFTIIPQETPCLRCLFPSPPLQGSVDTCDTAGVIGGIVHWVASHQATEAMKLLIGAVDQLNHTFMQWDLWYNQHMSVDITHARVAECIACVHHRYEYLTESTQDMWMDTLCGRNAVQMFPKHASRLTLDQWEQRLQATGPVHRNAFLLKLHIDSTLTMVIFADGRVIIQGTEDIALCKSLYSRYIGM